MNFEERVEEHVEAIQEKTDDPDPAFDRAHARTIAAYEVAVDDDHGHGAVAGVMVAALIEICEDAGIPEDQLLASIAERYEGGVEA